MRRRLKLRKHGGRVVERNRPLWTNIEHVRKLLLNTLLRTLFAENLTDEIIDGGRVSPKKLFSIRHIRYALLRTQGFPPCRAYLQSGFPDVRNDRHVRQIEDHPVVNFLVSTVFGEGLKSAGLSSDELALKAKELLDDPNAKFKDKANFLIELVEIGGYGLRLVELNLDLVKATLHSSTDDTEGLVEKLLHQVSEGQKDSNNKKNKWIENVEPPATSTTQEKRVDKLREKVEKRNSQASTSENGREIPSAPAPADIVKDSKGMGKEAKGQ